jgi:hypothetical protein
MIGKAPKTSRATSRLRITRHQAGNPISRHCCPKVDQPDRAGIAPRRRGTTAHRRPALIAWCCPP